MSWRCGNVPARIARSHRRGPSRRSTPPFLLEGRRLHPAIGREVADAAELLLRLSPAEGGRGQLDGYRHAFVGRYGTDREVALLELLDSDHGLGPPGSGPVGEAVDQAKLAVRAQVLRGLAVDALRERRLEADLDQPTLDRIALSHPTGDTAPVSLDLSVFVLAPSPEAIDAGAFELLIGPNLGAQQAGRNLGRFADLLGDAGSGALAEVAAAERHAQDEAVVAELVYLPPRPRSANVVVRPGGPRPRDRGRDDAGGRMAERHPAVGGPHRRARRALLRPLAGHRRRSAHPRGAHAEPPPGASRLPVPRGGRARRTHAARSLDRGPAADLPFLPRVRRGRVILAAAQWRIDCAMRDASLAPADPAFGAAVARFRTASMVPRHVYLTAGDNRLLLDLEAPEQLEQLRTELRRLRDGAIVLLQEPLPGPGHAWLVGPAGRHLTELVVPIVLRPSGKAGPPAGRRPAPHCPGHRRSSPPARQRLAVREALLRARRGGRPPHGSGPRLRPLRRRKRSGRPLVLPALRRPEPGACACASADRRSA